MKKTLSILFFVIFASCISTKFPEYKTEEFTGNKDFTLINYSKEFQIKTIEYYPDEEKIADIEGIPYGLFIGKTLNEELPDTLSVLVRYENREFQKDEILTFIQEDNSENNLPERKLYQKIKREHSVTWVYGTEYPAIWGEIIE